MTKFAELIERLEKATGPDHKLDKKIWRATGRSHTPFQIPNYTASIDAALTLVPEGAGLCWSASSDVLRRTQGSVPPAFNGWAGIYGGPFAGSECDSYGATPAIALCIAALKAIEAAQ